MSRGKSVKRALPDRSRAEVIAVLVAGIGFALVGGPAGVASALAVGVVWFLLPAVYAVALGHVLLAALTVGGGTPLEFVGVGLGLFAVLLAPAARLYRRETVVSITVFAAGALVFAFGITFTTAGALWIASLALVVIWVLVAYGIHRYELVTLGLVEGSA